MPASYELEGDAFPPNGGRDAVTENDTELLLVLLSEVEEQFAESRGCVQGASSKLEEGKEFEAAAAERARDQQLSEATRRKLQRRSQIINAEVKAELARAITQLRHASHHYKHVKAEIERAIRARDKRVADSSHAEGFATALSARMKKAEAEILELGAKKEEAEVKANRLQVEMDKLQGEHDKLLQHNEQLKGSVSEHETALDQQEQAANEGQLAQQNLQMRVEALENELASAHAQGLQLAKNRDSLLAQLRNSKEVVARITADNLMFINKIKHCENKLEQAVREREMLRQDLNSNDSRWFEHLRDELQKLTTQHMAEKDAQEASVAEAKENIRGELEQAHARCEALEGELAENKDAYAALQRAADLGQQKLAALQEAHDDLQNKHHSTAQSHGSLSAEKQTLSETLEATRRDNTAKTNVIEELQKQLQGAARTVAEATSERDTMREEAERLSEEKEKQKDLNEIILKEKHEMERKVYSTQADMDLMQKKLAALKAEVSSVKQEKDILSRQLSNWTGAAPSPAR